MLVRTTFGTDQAFAEQLCVEVAAQATAELIGATDKPPFRRAELLAWGVLFRVRYETVPAQRQEVSSRVTQLIWAVFVKHSDRVQFAFPGSTADVVRPEGGTAPPMAMGAEPA